MTEPINGSPTIGALAVALARVQASLLSDTATKAAMDQSLAVTLRQRLAGQEIAVLHTVTVQGRRAGVTTRLVHSSGEWLTTMAPLLPSPAATTSVDAVARQCDAVLLALLGVGLTAPANQNPIGSLARRPIRAHGADEGSVDSGMVASISRCQRPDAGDPASTAPARRPRIDKSALALAEPVRHRDRGHLRFVARQPCLVCGARPCDAHHVRFAQPSALGRRVSDVFTVPLCRHHHRHLHRTGNERAWWVAQGIDPLAAAAALWSQSSSQA